MISKENIKDQLIQFSQDVQKSDNPLQTFIEHPTFNFLLINYDKLDKSLKDFVDTRLKAIFNEFKMSIEKLPEGVEKRRGLRMKENDYILVSSLVVALENKTLREEKIFIDLREIFLRQMQNFVDLLSDTRKHSFNGAAEFAKINLFLFSVDEMLAAFHLCQHSYVNQAYSHIRTVTELLDKIELFDKQPKWAELWSSEKPEDRKRILNELSPMSVREKIGKGKSDPFYSFFSELGPHGTFRAMQARGGIVKQSISSGKREFRIWIGGVPFEHNIVSVSIFLLFTLGRLITSVISLYESLLNKEDCEYILKSFAYDNNKFYLENFIPWAKKEGFDTTPLTQLLNKINIDIDQNNSKRDKIVT